MLITASVFAILTGPIILPHIPDVHMISHILIHSISLIIAIFLASVSILSFNKRRSTRVLFMALGFSMLVIVEFLYFNISINNNIHSIIIPVVNIAISTHYFASNAIFVCDRYI